MKHVMLNTLHSILETVLLTILSLWEDILVMLAIQFVLLHTMELGGTKIAITLTSMIFITLEDLMNLMMG